MSEKSSSVITRVVLWLLTLPRYPRLALILFLSLNITMSLFPIVDELYIRFFFDPATVMLPSFVSVGFGVVYYVLGFIWVVNRWLKSRPPYIRIFVLLLIGFCSLALNIFLITMGISMLDTIPS